MYPLLGVTIFAAVAALYYYLGPIKAMYWSEPLDASPIRLNRSTAVVLTVLIFLLLFTGFYAQSMQFLVGHASLAQNGIAAATQVASR
jgi:NADH-quinone oxidoreductase subunit N